MEPPKPGETSEIDVLPTVRLTDGAKAKIKQIFAEQNLSLETNSVRVGIRGMSCSGPVYTFAIEQKISEHDFKSVQDGLTVVNDNSFSSDLVGIVVDYQESEAGRGFTFTNPLKVLSGGCSSGGCSSGCGSK